MPKPKPNAAQTDATLSAAQAAAVQYNAAARNRVLTHSARRPEEQRTPLLTFVVSSSSYADLELVAEDESEAVRAYRACHGIQGSTVTCRTRINGTDPRPQPQRLAAATT